MTPFCFMSSKTAKIRYRYRSDLTWGPESAACPHGSAPPGCVSAPAAAVSAPRSIGSVPRQTAPPVSPGSNPDERPVMVDLL
jgi:hypothetical protein